MNQVKRRQRWSVPLIFLIIVLLVGASGCSPDIPQRPQSSADRVEASFDAATGIIPLPNDLALDSEGTIPLLITPEISEESAQAEFYYWLSDLHGWLAETPIEIPFSGLLDEETVNSNNVLLFKVDSGELVAQELALVTYAAHSDGTSKIYAIANDKLVAGGQYAVVVTKNVKDANGMPIREPLPIFFAASQSPLVDEAGQPTVTGLAGDPDTAALLEGIRQYLAPVFDGVEAFELDRDDIAMAFRWTVTPDPLTVLDPTTGTVPAPNTLALDADGTFPEAALCHVNSSNAQGYFESYLANLHGWPTTTPITLPVSGTIDRESLTPDVVQLWKLNAEGDVERMNDYTIVLHEELFERCDPEMPKAGQQIEIIPSQELGYNESYFAFATRDIQSTEGLGLKPATALYMAMQPYNVVGEQGESLVSSLSDEQAQAIADVQAVIRPVVALIEQETELTYKDLVAVWSWFTWTDTFVQFDPDTGNIPFPNAFLMEDGSVNLPIAPNADPITAALFNELNTRRGFSSTASGWVPVLGELDEDSLTHESVLKAYVEGLPQLLDENDYSIAYDPQWEHIVVTPTSPLRNATQHVGVITTELKGENGRAVQPTPVFVFLRSPYALANSDGESLVDMLDDDTAVALEEARQAYMPLFAGAAFLNLERDNIALAWAYNTDDALQVLNEYRALTHYILSQRQHARFATRYCESTDEGCEDDPNYIDDVPAQFTDVQYGAHNIDMANIQSIQWAGEFVTTRFYDADSGILLDSTGLDEVGSETVGVSLFLPREDQAGGVRCEPPFEVAIVQHGLTHGRIGAISAMANELAAYPHCFASVAMDLPLHGGRAPQAESLHTLQPVEDSGSGFVSADLIGTKSNFIQSVIDLFVLSEVVRGDGTVSGLEGLTDGTPANPKLKPRASFVGMSLGGILGTLFATIEPTVDAVVLNATGGMMKTLLEGDDGQGSHFGQPIIAPLAAMGIVPGTFDYIQTMAFIQWAADIIDPITFAPALIAGGVDVLTFDAQDGEFRVCAGSQCPGGMQSTPPSNILLQMVQDDEIIANSATIQLAEQLDVSVDNTTFTNVPHGFLTTSNPSSDDYGAAYCARAQAAQWLSSAGDGDAVLPPALYADACIAEQP